MDGVAGEEDPARAIVVGEQKVLAPLAAIDHLVVHRHADGLLELPPHLPIRLDSGMQCPVALRTLHDEEGRVFVSDQIVPAAAGPVAERQSIEELLAAVEALPEPRDIGLATQADAQL